MKQWYLTTIITYGYASAFNGHLTADRKNPVWDNTNSRAFCIKLMHMHPQYLLACSVELFNHLQADENKFREK